jgi:hypothetical protein
MPVSRRMRRDPRVEEKKQRNGKSRIRRVSMVMMVMQVVDMVVEKGVAVEDQTWMPMPMLI